MHHEIVTPIKVNISMAERLMGLHDFTQLKEMAKVICVSSKLQLFHANDLLDSRVLQNGSFVPVLSRSSVSDALLEIVEMMQWTLQNRELDIQSAYNKHHTDPLYFDRRRL